MSSYGDSSSARGRAGNGSEDDWQGDGGGRYVDPPVSPGPTGRASIPPGRGSASVPTGRASASVPRARAVPPRGAVARASVPVAGRGYDDDPGYGDSDYDGPRSGRAPVGRAGVGRASVRPGSGSGGLRGGDPDTPTASAKARKRRRMNLIIGAFAILIMLAGGTVVGVTYYSTTVTPPNDIAASLELTSSVLYSDGKKEIVKLGEVNRVYTKIDQIPDHVQKAVASAEDRNFYQHEGIDYLGIMRAAWNNLTGGDQQGASTITQQYARNALELTDVTYARKAREAVLASKLNDKYSKADIMEFYLNTIYYGRGASSIETAAQAYFKKSVSKLSVAEAAVLAGVIKQPVPSDTHKGYDPTVNPEAAKDRWNYVLDGMQEKGWLPPGTDRSKLEYPKVQPWDDKKALGLETGLNTPAGNVVNYVTQEMAEMDLCEPGACMEKLRTGGFRVTTSIDPKMQKAAEDVASRKRKGSLLAGQPKNLMAAVVSINPENGRVLAYYGGESSTGFDYAGRNIEGGKVTGGHPPGSSFKIYTLAAALQEDISLNSRWDAEEIEEIGDQRGVENAGRQADCGRSCTLRDSTVKSYNVPFYSITKEIGVGKVLETAKAAGIKMMWDDDRVAHNLLEMETADIGRKPFDYQLGFGQYGITVLEHTNGVATMANRGVYNPAHFIVKVEKKNRATGEYELVNGEQSKPEQRIPKPVADDVTDALRPIAGNSGNNLRNGRQSAAKTGTWQLGAGRLAQENGHAWTVGYTPQLATSVWVGNVGPKEVALKTKNGSRINGGDLPADIWQRYMNDVHEGKERLSFPPAAGVGSDNKGDGVQPPPQQQQPQQQDGNNCLVPLFCPGNNNGQNNGQQNGGQQNGGQQNGGQQNGGQQNGGGQNGGGDPNGGGQDDGGERDDGGGENNGGFPGFNRDDPNIRPGGG